MKTSDIRSIAQRNKELSLRLDRKAPLRRYDSNPALHYEISGRSRATGHAGVAALLELARATGLDKALDSHLNLLCEHRPCTESDQVLAMVAAVPAGGRSPEHLRTLRHRGR